jgi:tripeptidyl-peptidase-1
MVGASYQLYRRTGTNDTTILRTIGYGLPAVLHDHVQTIAPTTYFASTRALRQIPRRRPVGDNASRELATAPSSRNDDDEPDEPMDEPDEPDDDSDEPDDDTEITPSILRSLYRTFAYVPAATGQNVVGVAGFQNEFPSEVDLAMFMDRFRTDAVDATYTVEKINNGRYDPSNPGAEANLDLQYTQALTYPTPHIYYSTGGIMRWSPTTGQPAPGDLFLEWLLYMTHQPTVPQTISISYSDFEKELPVAYAKVLCLMFGELGARGASVLFPSGNSGVGGGDCKVGDSVQFIPEFPSSCECGISSLLGSSTPSQAQVAHHIATVSQVPGSLAWVARH